MSIGMKIFAPLDVNGNFARSDAFHNFNVDVYNLIVKFPVAVMQFKIKSRLIVSPREIL